MKKVLLVSTAMCLQAFAANADPVCFNTSGSGSDDWCDAHGYDQTLSDCYNNNSGYDAVPFVACPFDTSKVFCQSAAEKDCQKGDILWSDNKCYNGTPSEKTAKAIVFDEVNELAVDLTETQLAWQTQGTPAGGDHDWWIYQHEHPHLMKWDGTSTTQTELGDKCSGENLESLSPLAVTVNGNSGFATYGCNIRGARAFPDYIPVGLGFWNVNIPGGVFSRFYRTNSPTNGGWADSFAIMGQFGNRTSTYAVPAVSACYNKNGSSDVCSDSFDVSDGRAWFLPSAGDMFELMVNLPAVQKGLQQARATLIGGVQNYAAYSGGTDFGDGRSYWTSTQASYRKQSDGGHSGDGNNSPAGDYYFGAWFGRPMSASGGSMVFDTAAREQQRMVRCVYHYGYWDLHIHQHNWRGGRFCNGYTPMIIDGTSDMGSIKAKLNVGGAGGDGWNAHAMTGPE